jgi:hypothetical protein
MVLDTWRAEVRRRRKLLRMAVGAACRREIGSAALLLQRWRRVNSARASVERAFERLYARYAGRALHAAWQEWCAPLLLLGILCVLLVHAV